MGRNERAERSMKVLLVGNYEFDGSKSMQIWAETLHRELLARGIDAESISPKPLLGKLRPSAAGVGKWLGYVDRFVLFPHHLKAAATQADIVHLCDHGSAMFALKLKDKKVVVTCHDMLAVRGAMGEISEMRASVFGRLLQQWICKGLRRAAQVACVSQYTLDDATRILRDNGNLCKVLNGLNYPFKRPSTRSGLASCIRTTGQVCRRSAGDVQEPGPSTSSPGEAHHAPQRPGPQAQAREDADRAAGRG